MVSGRHLGATNGAVGKRHHSADNAIFQLTAIAMLKVILIRITRRAVC